MSTLSDEIIWQEGNFLKPTQRKNGRKLRRCCYVVTVFQATWAKIFDLLRVIAVHEAMCIEFYIEF